MATSIKWLLPKKERRYKERRIFTPQNIPRSLHRKISLSIVGSVVYLRRPDPTERSG